MTRPATLWALLVLAVIAAGWLLLTRSPAAVDAPTATVHVVDEPSALEAQARELLDAGQPEQALALLEARAAECDDDLPARLLRVDLTRHLRDSQQAVDLGALAIERWPASSRAQHGYAQALGTHMRKGGLLTAPRWLSTYKQAMADAVRLDPHNLAARLDEVGFHVYAPAIAGGDTQEARRLAAELSLSEPAAGAMMEALILSQQGDDRAALEVCARAVAEHPEYQDLNVVYASLLEDNGRSWEALPLCDRVVAGGPSPAYYRALYQRARLNLDRGNDAAAALADLDRVDEHAPPADFMPEPARIAYHRGRALQSMGLQQDARNAFLRALELDPQLSEAGAALASLP